MKKPQAKAPRYPWYDSWWLELYVRAKEFIGQNHAQRLDDFIRALEPLRTRQDFELRRLEGFFSAAQEATIRRAFQSIVPDQLELHEVKSYGRYVVHNPPMLAAVHAEIAPAVGELVGEAVEPAYSVFALYTRAGKCPLHLDAPGVSKWTFDYCIEQSEPWPISFSEVFPWPEDHSDRSSEWAERVKASPRHRFASHVLNPGQAALFAGSSQWHVREPMPNARPESQCSLMFLHFIPKGMKEVADWKTWESRFRIPGLTSALE